MFLPRLTMRVCNHHSAVVVTTCMLLKQMFMLFIFDEMRVRVPSCYAQCRSTVDQSILLNYGFESRCVQPKLGTHSVMDNTRH